MSGYIEGLFLRQFSIPKSKFFPKRYTTAQMQDVILRLLEGYQRQRRRSQER